MPARDGQRASPKSSRACSFHLPQRGRRQVPVHAGPHPERVCGVTKRSDCAKLTACSERALDDHGGPERSEVLFYREKTVPGR